MRLAARFPRFQYGHAARGPASGLAPFVSAWYSLGWPRPVDHLTSETAHAGAVTTAPAAGRQARPRHLLGGRAAEFFPPAPYICQPGELRHLLFGLRTAQIYPPSAPLSQFDLQRRRIRRRARLRRPWRISAHGGQSCASARLSVICILTSARTARHRQLVRPQANRMGTACGSPPVAQMPAPLAVAVAASRGTDQPQHGRGTRRHSRPSTACDRHRQGVLGSNRACDGEKSPRAPRSAISAPGGNLHMDAHFPISRPQLLAHLFPHLAGRRHR